MLGELCDATNQVRHSIDSPLHAARDLDLSIQVAIRFKFLLPAGCSLFDAHNHQYRMRLLRMLLKPTLLHLSTCFCRLYSLLTGPVEYALLCLVLLE